nr:porin [uncultured Albidiferax sp.]
MNKRHLVAATVLCVGLPVSAQTASSVTLYGIIDASARTQTGLTRTYARSSFDTTVIASGVGLTSRWGLRGTEDLGGGLRASFQLESGINVDTGASANAVTFFDRASVVGLAGHWGSVTLGRQNTLTADSAGVADPIGLRFASLNPNIQNVGLSAHQLGIEYGATGSSAASNRVNNSAKLSVPVGGLVARAMHGFGEAVGSGSLQSVSGLGLDYVTPGLSLTTAYTRFKDINDRALNAANVGASWLVLPSLRLMANFGYNRGATSATSTTTHRIAVAGVNYAITPAVDLLAGYYRLNRERTNLADDGFNRVLAYLEYKFSRRSKVYLELDTTRWKGNYLGTGNKASSNGVSLGMTHAF